MERASLHQCPRACAHLIPLALVLVVVAFVPRSVLAAPPPITLADNGRVIDLALGDQVLLALGEDYVWTVRVADTDVLGRVVNVTVIQGTQGVYEARRTGQTTLEATGDPPCRQAQPACARPSLLFRVQARVAQGSLPGLPNTGGGAARGSWEWGRAAWLLGAAAGSSLICLKIRRQWLSSATAAAITRRGIRSRR